MSAPEHHDWTRRRFLQGLGAAAFLSWGGTLSVKPAAAATTTDDLPRRGDRPFETHPGLETVPGTLRTQDGTRLRTIVTRPAGATQRLPAILFVPWLSCDSIELSSTADDGWSRMLRRVARESGLVMMRTDKRGVGDSEGDCSRLDYDTELSDHRDALAHLARSEFVDPRRIVVFGASMGGNFAPLVAADQDVAGVITWGGGARSWFERMLAFERNRRELSDLPAERIGREMKEVAAFLHAYLVEGRSPARIASADSVLGEAWSQRLLGTEGELHYGRPVAFHQQAQRHDWAGAWARVDAPALVLFGEYDWYEDAAGSALAARIAARRHPGHTRFRLIPGTDHHFTRYARIEDAVGGKGGTVDEAPVVAEILRWLGEVTARVRP